jgi:hypothetical protein
MKKKNSLHWEDIVFEDKYSKAKSKRLSNSKIKDIYRNENDWNKNTPPLEEIPGNYLLIKELQKILPKASFNLMKMMNKSKKKNQTKNLIKKISHLFRK